VSFVIDTSITMAWCFKDERTAPVMDVLYRLEETPAHALLLWPLEASNALLMAERRKRVDRGQRAELIEFLRDLPIRLDGETTDHVWTSTFRLAQRHRLSTYDAAYLELAQRLKLPLATLDKELIRAAKASGTTLLGT
jgi:predicted nucleic acid-binding protein